MSFADDAWFILSTFLLIGVPAIALPMPLAFLMQSFGRHRWAARRALAVSLACATVGYLALLGYYLLAGIPEPIASNSQSSQSPFHLALMGALLASGYGSLAAFVYFYWHRNNPVRSWW